MKTQMLCNPNVRDLPNIMEEREKTMWRIAEENPKGVVVKVKKNGNIIPLPKVETSDKYRFYYRAYIPEDLALSFGVKKDKRDTKYELTISVPRGEASVYTYVRKKGNVSHTYESHTLIDTSEIEIV